MQTENTFKPHEQRVIDERIALDEKREKLAAFMNTEIFRSLPFDERKDLHLQAGYMGSYSECLLRRIARFSTRTGTM